MFVSPPSDLDALTEERSIESAEIEPEPVAGRLADAGVQASPETAARSAGSSGAPSAAGSVVGTAPVAFSGAETCYSSQVSVDEGLVQELVVAGIALALTENPELP